MNRKRMSNFVWSQDINEGFSFHAGIKGYRFTAPKAMLEDPRINGDNMCFCMKDSVNDCPYGGVLSVSTCRGGAINYLQFTCTKGERVYIYLFVFVP